MFFPEGQYRVYLYGQPADLRCSFDGLQALTRHAMGQDPSNGSLYMLSIDAVHRFACCILTAVDFACEVNV